MPDRKESLEKDCNLCHLIDFQEQPPNYLLQLVLHYENVHNKQGLKTKTLFQAPSSAWGLSSLKRDLAQSARLAMSSLLWIVTHVPNVKVIHVLCDLINASNILSNMILHQNMLPDGLWMLIIIQWDKQWSQAQT